MNAYKTEQEEFWAGEFGSNYISRNPSDLELAGRSALFSRIFSRLPKVNSIIEFGANIGNNLRVLKRIAPEAALTAVEINASAVKELQNWGGCKVLHQSILEEFTNAQSDLAFVSGVLIHINPDTLVDVYHKLYDASCHYIVLIEYYNPSPTEIPYRGHSGKLFKRDFAGEMLDIYPDLELVDYGFVYHRDNHFPLDDLTWFILEKK